MTTTKEEEIRLRFTSHNIDENGIADMRTIRRKVRELALLIEETCPQDSREKAAALTHLVTVMMFANSAISLQYPLDENDV